jgi:hypothetical protein
MLNFTELTFIVTGANLAGYMEADEQITASDDEEMTRFLQDCLNEYEQMQEESDWWDAPPWIDYIKAKLIEHYGTEK